MNEYQVTIIQGETISEYTVFAWSKRQALFYISTDKMFDGKSGVKRDTSEPPSEQRFDPNDYFPNEVDMSHMVMPGYECD